MEKASAIPAIAPVRFPTALMFTAPPKYVETLTLEVTVSIGVVDVEYEMMVDKDGWE